MILLRNISSLEPSIGSSSYPSIILKYASLEYIGVSAFYGVDTLKYVYFNSKIEVIEGNSFYDCPIEYVVIPKSVKYIGIGAFNNGNIFCEVSSKPDKWDKDFAFGKLITQHVKQFPHQRNQSERQISVPQSKIRFLEF